MRKIFQVVALALPALLLAAPAVAARFTPDRVDMAAAKREGTVSWYTSTPIEAAQKIANLFEKQTGIKVELFRSGGSAVMSRFMQEMSANTHAADVITTSDPAAAAALAKQGTFVAFKPENFDKIPAEVKDKDGYWIAQRLNLLAIAVRGDKIKPGDRPKTWSDLTQPRFKGLEVMPDPSFTSLQLVAVNALAKKLGWSFYERLQKDDIMIVQGHEQVEDMLKRGERVIAAEELDSYAAADRQLGAPIVTVFPTEGVFAIASPTAIVKGGPNPDAAKAFAAFMIGDAVQNEFAQEGIYAARADAPPPAGSPKLSTLKLMPLDFDDLAQHERDDKAHFNQIFQ
jgi:iron(III) transport system substrate-binding protein